MPFVRQALTHLWLARQHAPRVALARTVASAWHWVPQCATWTAMTEFCRSGLLTSAHKRSSCVLLRAPIEDTHTLEQRMATRASAARRCRVLLCCRLRYAHSHARGTHRKFGVGRGVSQCTPSCPVKQRPPRSAQRALRARTGTSFRRRRPGCAQPAQRASTAA